MAGVLLWWCLFVDGFFMSFDDFFCLCETNHFVFVLVAKKNCEVVVLLC